MTSSMKKILNNPQNVTLWFQSKKTVQMIFFFFRAKFQVILFCSASCELEISTLKKPVKCCPNHLFGTNCNLTLLFWKWYRSYYCTLSRLALKFRLLRPLYLLSGDIMDYSQLLHMLHELDLNFTDILL